MAESNGPPAASPSPYTGGQTHEIDPRWTAVDSYTMNHLHPSTSIPSTSHLQYALDNSAKHGLPNIAVSAAQGKFLQLQARMLGAQHVLEVGTLGAYSTIWLAHANKTVRITTVEMNPHHADVARQNLRNAGVADRVSIELGAGLDVLPKLLADFQSGKRPPWDMVFIDADKVNGWAYFDLAVKMCRPGACIIVDNVVRKGTLVDEEKAKSDPNVKGSRRTVEMVGKDERFEAVVLQLVGEKYYDGILVAVVGQP